MDDYNNPLNGNGRHKGISSVGYTLYIPLNYTDGRPVEPELLTWILSELLGPLGALTKYAPSVGFWTSPIGEVFRDDILPIQVVVTSGSEAEDWLTHLAGELAIMLKQQSIFLVAQDVEVIESTPPMSTIRNGKEEHNEQVI